MRRVLFAILLLLAASPSLGQQQPRITVDLEGNETLVGQPLVLRIKVLVATWLPQPPDFPSLEIPGLMVRLPEGASSPTSEPIDGETWSGVQRAYRLYPLEPGNYAIPAQTIRITVADPGKTDPIPVTAQTPDIVFTAVIPEAARDLVPPLLATSFSLEQTIDNETELTPGGAVTRTVTARIGGTTPILIPALMPQPDSPSVKTYPGEPAVSEAEDRGVLSGQRVERTSYVAQDAGVVELPAIEINWYNLETDAVETASLPAVTLTISEGTQPNETAEPTGFLRIALLVACAGIVLLIARRYWPWIRHRYDTMLSRWQASEPHANGQVLKALKSRDLSQVHTAFDTWGTHFDDLDQTRYATMSAALAEIGRAVYGSQTTGVSQKQWTRAEEAFRALRRSAVQAKTALHHKTDLPPLNTSKNRSA